VTLHQHALQPLHTDDQGVVRFKANAIVRFLLDAGPFDMNQLAMMPFDDADRAQFAQLIGYSLCGFGELCYVSDELYARSVPEQPGVIKAAWQPIATAPKDGRALLLLSAGYTREGIAHPPKCHIGQRDSEGTSWVDENGQCGRLADNCYTLATTGIWLSGGGWFQPNEVTHWMALPMLPQE
jgi:hypothetical protein